MYPLLENSTTRITIPEYIQKIQNKIPKCSKECCYCRQLVGVAVFAKVQGLEGFADFQAVQVSILKDVTCIDVRTFCEDFLKEFFCSRTGVQ